VGEGSHKVVEVSPVVEDALERALDRWTAEGYDFQSIHFVMRDGSHRPAMAYLFFLRRTAPAPEPAGSSAIEGG